MTQPGTYTAALYAGEADTPYLLKPVEVTMRVTVPSGWGLLKGAVTAAAGGHAIQGATVEVDTRCTEPGRCGAAAYTIKTGPDGSYQWWLPAADNRLVVIGAKDDYIQQVTMAGVGFAGPGGGTTVLNFALAQYHTQQP